MVDQNLTYSIRELAHRAGVAPDTIRGWIKRGLVPPVAFRGPKTRYGDLHLQRIRAIRKLKGESLALNDIATRIATMSPEDVRNLVDPPVVTAPGPAAPSFPHETWKRVVVCPGIELHVANTPMHMRLAQQIYDDCVARLNEVAR